MSDKIISGVTVAFQKTLNSTIKYKILLVTLIPFLFYLTMRSYFGGLDFLDDFFVSGPSLLLITGSFILVASVFLIMYFAFCALITIPTHTPKNEHDLLYSTKGVSDIPTVSLLVCILSYQFTLLEAWKGLFSKNLYFLLMIPALAFIVGYFSLKYVLRYCEAWYTYRKYKIKNEMPLFAMSIMIAFIASAHFLFSLVFFNKHDNTWSLGGYFMFIILMVLQHLPAVASVTARMRKKSYKDQAKAFFITASVVLFFIFYFAPSLALKSIPISLQLAGKTNWDIKSYIVKKSALDGAEYDKNYWGDSRSYVKDNNYYITGVIAFKTKDEYILCPARLRDILKELFRIDFVWQNIQEKSDAKVETEFIIPTCPKIKRNDIKESLI
ncbi:hypothetical protein [Pectobacterium carotovorum]|uniref:hypothetical protein n=1 Tax=Pectobacterium carotovorum TaxID=554 RepID=UPI00050185A1|nr:hypothetical protein [Pectobacterium carotovorum]KFX00108.1 hypothetical protein JV33_08645 [Pectobacterium carotovorum subsp. carotovorum]KML72335.1 hypothetical protein G032_04530 [Pectobacterium carotovorum subsp. carotovorum ICMP 5702]SHG55819.1 hypothetical protein SAMN05444147_103112 [Pectobacterium carotovorum]